MIITRDPATCECRRIPWVTIDMLGGLYHVRDDGIRIVRCPDSQHCLRGAPIRDGRLDDHWRNLDRPSCKWTGIQVRESMPCRCGGWPWIRAGILKFVFHEGISRTNPIRSIGCPGCRNNLVEVENCRIAVHCRQARKPCAWSGIYVAVGDDVPPLGAPARLVTQ